jgi:rhomboid protease GluP
VEELQEQHVEVYRARNAKSVREYALVLNAQHIPFVEIAMGKDRVLAVPAPEFERAQFELSHYAEENRNWPPRPAKVITLANGKQAAFWYGIVIVTFFLVDREGLFHLPWHTAGRADAEAILSGEWWRTITALTLHADLLHLASNLAFGAFFIAFASHLLGTGVGLLAMLGSGILGTLLNAIIQDPSHLSIGASTSVFGAIGTYVACLWAQRRRQKIGALYIWSPLLFGSFFLGQLGMSGVNTDVVAHGTGFASGLLIGAILGRLGSEVLTSERLQSNCSIVAALLIAIGWIAALV